MEDRSAAALNEYEAADQEIKKHWIWSLCHIAPGDFDELIRRVADRCQGMKLDLDQLKQQARQALETKKERSPYANPIRISNTALRC